MKNFIKYNNNSIIILIIMISNIIITEVQCNDNNDHDDHHSLSYNTEQFKKNVPNKNHFVMFYAPWCGHCQRLAPTWGQLAEMLNIEGDSKVTIAKVDCTQHKEICSENDVTGYPTLKFFKVGETESVKFRGIRDLATLTNFINERIGEVPEGAVELPQIPNVVNGLVELTDDTFLTHIGQGKHFIKFYAPWCGHCQKLAPAWEQLASNFLEDNSVSVGKVDCTLYRGSCTPFEVKGYPTLLWIEDGKKVEKYSGGRSLSDLKAYVEKMTNKAKIVDVPKKVEKEKTEDSSAVLTLTSDNFESGIENEFVFVKFFAPWCGHCKRLAPTWEELGKKFIGNPHIIIAKVDCSIQSNKVLCSEENVDGFPSLFMFKDGVKIAEYDGSRGLEDLQEFVIEQLGDLHDEL